MSALSRIRARVRRVPPVFRISGPLVLIALVGGQIAQRQPAGRWTAQVIAISASLCPTATHHGGGLTVADGAHALDRAVYRRVVDWKNPRPRSRCRNL